MMFWTSRSKLWTKCFSQCIPSLAARLMRVVVPPSRFGSWDRTARGFWSHYVVQVISSQLGITSPTAQATFWHGAQSLSRGCCSLQLRVLAASVADFAGVTDGRSTVR